MTDFSKLREEIKNNKGILFLLLSKTGCSVCGDFKKVIDEIKSEHEDYLTVLEVNTEQVEGLDIVPHTIYPMSFFYVRNQPLPFIRQGLVYGEALGKEIEKFKQVLDGKDANDVFREE